MLPPSFLGSGGMKMLSSIVLRQPLAGGLHRQEVDKILLGSSLQEECRNGENLLWQGRLQPSQTFVMVLMGSARKEPVGDGGDLIAACVAAVELDVADAVVDVVGDVADGDGASVAAEGFEVVVVAAVVVVDGVAVAAVAPVVADG